MQEFAIARVVTEEEMKAMDILRKMTTDELVEVMRKCAAVTDFTCCDEKCPIGNTCEDCVAKLLLEAAGRLERATACAARFSETIMRAGEMAVNPEMCRVGDTVYTTDGIRVYESKIQSVIYRTNTFDFDERAIKEKNVFLKRKDAEKAASQPASQPAAMNDGEVR